MSDARRSPVPTAPGWLSQPALSLLLALVWLLLQQSVAPVQLLVAAGLGLGLPRLLHGLRAQGPGTLDRATRRRRVGSALRLFAVVLWDIVAANLVVARIVLSPRADPRPAWMAIDLSLRDPTAIALLAAIITTTPGTVSCVVDDAGYRLFVHALDCDDPVAVAAEIVRRYERPLKEIFE